MNDFLLKYKSYEKSYTENNSFSEKYLGPYNFLRNNLMGRENKSSSIMAALTQIMGPGASPPPSLVLTGTVPPTPGIGTNGQLYINTSNFTLYVKYSGAWITLLQSISNLSYIYASNGYPEGPIAGNGSVNIDLSDYTTYVRILNRWAPTTTAPAEIFLIVNQDAPSVNLGVTNNLYLDSSTGTIYSKPSGNWAILEGPFGTSNVILGAGLPLATMGIDGNLYVNKSNGSLYIKGAGAWTVLISGGGFMTGVGTPGSPLGVVGSTYVDQTNGIVYVKLSTGWTVVANPSSVGTNKLISGSGVPSAALGSVGDLYVDTATGLLYNKLSTGWTPVIAAQGSSAVPIGTILSFGGSVAPTGYLICDGSAYPTATYPALSAVIGTTYGGAGANFNVPDMRGRSGYGLNTTVTQFNVLGKTGGALQTTLTVGQLPSHTHGVTDPGHSHAVPNGLGILTGTNSILSGLVGGTQLNQQTSSATTGITINPTGNGDPISILSPYITINYIIRAV